MTYQSKVAILILYMVLCPFTSSAQISRQDIVAHLVGTNHRVWLLEDYRSNLGSCSGNGQSFDFFKDGILTWKKCTNGKLESKVIGWTISEASDGSGDITIIFSKPIEIKTGKPMIKDMFLSFSKSSHTGGKPKMFLKSKRRHQTDLFTTIELNLQ